MPVGYDFEGSTPLGDVSEDPLVGFVGEFRAAGGVSQGMMDLRFAYSSLSVSCPCVSCDQYVFCVCFWWLRQYSEPDGVKGGLSPDLITLHGILLGLVEPPEMSLRWVVLRSRGSRRRVLIAGIGGQGLPARCRNEFRWIRLR